MKAFQANAFLQWLDQSSFLFLVETICLWAFGFAWLVKGGAIRALNDATDKGAAPAGAPVPGLDTQDGHAG